MLCWKKVLWKVSIHANSFWKAHVWTLNLLLMWNHVIAAGCSLSNGICSANNRCHQWTGLRFTPRRTATQKQRLSTYPEPLNEKESTELLSQNPTSLTFSMRALIKFQYYWFLKGILLTTKSCISQPRPYNHLLQSSKTTLA